MQMKILVYLLIFLTAISSLFNIGEYTYAVIVILMYLLINVLYFLKYKNDNILCFELFFGFSFILCTFLTVFITPLMDTWHLRIFIIDSNLIIKTYRLGFIGYLFYMLALIQDEQHGQITTFEVPKNAYSFANLICTFFIVLFFLQGGIKLLSIYSDEKLDLAHRTEGWGEFLVYAIIAYCVSIPLNFKKAGIYRSVLGFLSNLNLVFIINSVILIFMLLASGYRSQSFAVLLPLIIAFSIQVRPFKKREITILLIGGVILMLYLGDTRSGRTFDLTNFSFLDSVRDFTSANAANGFLIDYTDKHECTYGTNYLLRLFSVIPFMQTTMLEITPPDFYAPSSSFFFTNQMEIERGGLGTGMIGDMYYSFSFVGVIVIMYLLGYICRKVSRLGSPYVWALFMNFVGNAIFLPRGDVSSIFRSMSFGVIIMFIILKISGNSRPLRS